MKKNNIIKIIVCLAVAGLSGGCAKFAIRPDGPDRADEIKRKQDIFLAVELELPPQNNSEIEFQKKALGEWRDFLEMLENDYSGIPVNIAVPVDLIKILRDIENGNMDMDPLLTLHPDRLNRRQAEYLAGKYELDTGTASLLTAQVMEALEYLGRAVKESEAYEEFVHISTYTAEVKDKILQLMEEEIKVFNAKLKEILDKEHIGEAATSLSGAYLPLLDRERTKVQVLEGLVAYNRWRGNFPAGFIPRGGYITRDAIEEIEKTGIEWIIVRSTKDITYEGLQTKPVVIYTAPEIFELKNDTRTFRGAYGIRPLIKTPAPAADFLEKSNDRYISFNELKEIIYSIDSSTRTVALSTAPFSPFELEIDDKFRKLKNYLGDVKEKVESYRNSGRASLEKLIYVQDRLLTAESGILAENISERKYDSIFRRVIIDIYRNIGLRPPVRYFLPVTEIKPVEPDKDLISKLEIKADGKIEPGEWDGAYKVNFASAALKSFYAGFDGKNIYFRVDMSTGEVKAVSVIAGHVDADSAALYPREMPQTVENIQDFPLSAEIAWRSEVPLKTVIYRPSGEEWETLTGNYDVGYSSGTVEFTLPFRYFGVQSNKKIYMKILADGRIYPEAGHMEITAPELTAGRSIISGIDPGLDNYGPGNYSIAGEYEEYAGNTDFRKIDIEERSGEKIISLQFSSIDNPYNSPLGFGNARIDLYIDINRQNGLGNVSMLPRRNAYVMPEVAWEYAVTVSGNDKAVYNTAFDKIGEPEVSVSRLNNTVNIFISNDLIETPVERWGVVPVVTAAGSDGKLIEVSEEPEQTEAETGENDSPGDESGNYGFSGRLFESDTNIIDVILPPGYRQSGILGKNRDGEAIEIPALRKRTD